MQTLFFQLYWKLLLIDEWHLFYCFSAKDYVNYLLHKLLTSPYDPFLTCSLWYWSFGTSSNGSNAIGAYFQKLPSFSTALPPYFCNDITCALVRRASSLPCGAMLHGKRSSRIFPSDTWLLMDKTWLLYRVKPWAVEYKTCRWKKVLLKRCCINGSNLS